jgi:hypothetical protein
MTPPPESSNPHPRPTHSKALLASLLSYLSILGVTSIVFDVAGYWLLPNHIAHRFRSYRTKDEPPDDAFGGRSTETQYYYTSHPRRGFDINPGARGKHSIAGVTYPIWANSLGCFDHDWKTVPPGYFYFAGDSFTWGYSSYGQKFATLFEKRTGIPSLKCGVTHTGTLHQFDKFNDIVTSVGRRPQQVVIGYCLNDVENDYAYPHSTVIRGWLVDNVFLDTENYSKVRVEDAWLEEKVRAKLSREDVRHSPQTGWDAAKRMIKRYSLVAQVLSGAVGRLRAALTPRVVEQSPPRGFVYEGRMVSTIYSLMSLHTRDGKFRYASTRFTDANRAALIAWSEHAKLNNYGLTVAIMPEKEFYERDGFFSELIDFLRLNDIDYIDLTAELRALGAPVDEVCWERDVHLSPSGNRLVAQILVRRFGKPIAPEKR